MIRECDFLESTERGDYCRFEHAECHKEDCFIQKYGLGKEDLDQAYEALYQIKADMNK